jgi:hypothetical protein
MRLNRIAVRAAAYADEVYVKISNGGVNVCRYSRQKADIRVASKALPELTGKLKTSKKHRINQPMQRDYGRQGKSFVDAWLTVSYDRSYRVWQYQLRDLL